MNEYEQLENELRRLRPVRPPEGLVDRLAEVLGREEVAAATSVRRPPLWMWRRAIMTAAAALLVVGVGLWAVRLRHGEDPPVDAEPMLAAVPAPTNVPSLADDPPAVHPAFVRYAQGTALVDERDMGPVLMRDGVPVRVVRYTLLDQASYRDAGRGRTFTATVPREEVRFVPVMCD